ncbi:MAG: GNAT family acetyltransferase [Rhodospirillales bacterium]
MTKAVRRAAPADAPALIRLWERCGLTRPHNDPAKDIALALNGPASDILLIEDADTGAAADADTGAAAGAVTGSVMVGHDGHRGWIYYLAVDPERRRENLGRALTSAAEAWLAERGIWKAMLMIREDNTQVRAFYERLGYAEEPRTVMAKALMNPSERP